MISTVEGSLAAVSEGFCCFCRKPLRRDDGLPDGWWGNCRHCHVLWKVEERPDSRRTFYQDYVDD